MTGLTGKQSAFVDAYLGEAHLNATKAAQIAGYTGKYNVLAAQGCENLKNPKVKAAIEARKAIASGKNPLTTNKVLADVEELRIRALLKGDLVTAKGCSELQAKYLGMLTDRLAVEDVNETRRMNERREEEARQIAQTRLRMVG